MVLGAASVWLIVQVLFFNSPYLNHTSIPIYIYSFSIYLLFAQLPILNLHFRVDINSGERNTDWERETAESIKYFLNLFGLCLDNFKFDILSFINLDEIYLRFFKKKNTKKQIWHSHSLWWIFTNNLWCTFFYLSLN